MTKQMKTMMIAMAGAGLLFGLNPTAGYAADNVSFLQTMRGKGAEVRTLSAEENAAIQGANWTIVRKLLVENVKIYGRVGWELGRLISIRQYKIDPGPYPGLKAALTGRF